MKYAEAKPGRVFVIRLEDGDILHETIEAFARAHSIAAAALIVLGGADEGSRLVVGPESARGYPVHPMEHVLTNVHEVAGVGTVFPGADGAPVLHMHIAGGRNDGTVTGCVRLGVKVWHVMEVILWELTDTSARRLPDEATGFALLQP
ncbi:MAG: DNA-binding protein [Deltaproteobacteria bacterium]|nr:DNA-binding protein [Deltaproteobacteria bacterium]